MKEKIIVETIDAALPVLWLWESDLKAFRDAYLKMILRMYDKFTGINGCVIVHMVRAGLSHLVEQYYDSIILRVPVFNSCAFYQLSQKLSVARSRGRQGVARWDCRVDARPNPPNPPDQPGAEMEVRESTGLPSDSPSVFRSHIPVLF